MRRLAGLIAACSAAALAAAAIAGEAVRVTATTSPPGAGSPDAPLAKRLTVEASLADQDAPRPVPIVRYETAAQGLVGFLRHFPSCTFEQASEVELGRVLEACRRAQIGEGVVNVVGGSSDDRQDKIPCVLQLRVFDIGRTAAIRLDRAEVADCLADPQTAIRARLRRIRIGGIPTDRIEFEVPEVLRHPLEGLEATVVSTRMTLYRRTRRVRVSGARRTVGVVSSIGCGRRRLAIARGIDETGAVQTVQRRIRC